jgi:adsorption protein B
MEDFILQYLYFIELLTVIAAVVIAISSLDDIFVDAYYWITKARGSWAADDARIPDLSVINNVPERSFAIIIPAWEEHEVIFSMLYSNTSLVKYQKLHYFVGAYQNDPHTQAEVKRAQTHNPNIHLTIVPRDGPTSKADCLNQIIAGIFLYEAEARMQFAGVIMHDSEDLIHPHEIRLFNVLVGTYDFIQLPVFSFARPLRSMVAGIYMDEFAEMHTKDLRVRQRVSGVIPCAGVSACFSRDAIVKLLDGNHGEVFRVSAFTEDYDVAFRVSELGLKSAFIPYKVDYAIDVDATGKPALLRKALPVATREFFPSNFEAAYRQRARWQLGIVFQGIRELGWKGTWGTKYFLARDRKGVITGTTVMLGYFVMVSLLVIIPSFWWFHPDKYPEYEILSQPLAIMIFLLNLAFLGLRLLNRMVFTYSIYGWSHALMSVPRLVVANVVNFFATARAIRVYLIHLITHKPLTWDKTKHSYPVVVGNIESALTDASMDSGSVIPLRDQVRK